MKCSKLFAIYLGLSLHFRGPNHYQDTRSYILLLPLCIDANIIIIEIESKYGFIMVKIYYNVIDFKHIKLLITVITVDAFFIVSSVFSFILAVVVVVIFFGQFIRRILGFSICPETFC